MEMFYKMYPLERPNGSTKSTRNPQRCRDRHWSRNWHRLRHREGLGDGEGARHLDDASASASAIVAVAMAVAVVVTVVVVVVVIIAIVIIIAAIVIVVPTSVQGHGSLGHRRGIREVEHGQGREGNGQKEDGLARGHLVRRGGCCVFFFFCVGVEQTRGWDCGFEEDGVVYILGRDRGYPEDGSIEGVSMKRSKQE